MVKTHAANPPRLLPASLLASDRHRLMMRMLARRACFALHPPNTFLDAKALRGEYVDQRKAPARSITRRR